MSKRILLSMTLGGVGGIIASRVLGLFLVTSADVRAIALFIGFYSGIIIGLLISLILEVYYVYLSIEQKKRA